jgi:hypothetical protein
MEKPRFLFLEGSGAPPPRLRAPLQHPPAPLERPLAPPLTIRQWAAMRLSRGSILRLPPRPLGTGASQGPTYHRWSAPCRSLPRPRTSSPAPTGEETLLLAQPVLLVVLVEALLPPDPPLLREGRPVPLPLLCGVAGGLRPRRQRVRSGGVDVHGLQEGTIRRSESVVGEVKCKGRLCSPGPCRGASRTTTGRRRCAALS